jgi:hypothetical protein
MEHDSVDKPDDTASLPSMITASNWRSRVQAWSDTNKITNGHGPEIVRLFDRAFTYAQYADQAWFGLHDDAASLVVGGVYLAAINRSAKDRGIWLLVDPTKSHIDNSAVDLKQAAFAKDHAPQVFWAHAKSFDNIDAIVRDDSLWEAFSTASRSIRLAKRYTNQRNDRQLRHGKVQLSRLLNQDAQPTTDPEEYVRRADRIRVRGQQFPPSGEPHPSAVQMSVRAYNRDPAVRAWALQRSQGRCELCTNEAPFFTEGSAPYLECHHIVTLADGGPDTPSNTAALCPNCHRNLHYGEHRLELQRKLADLILEKENIAQRGNTPV